jgi:hypothetical protein
MLFSFGWMRGKISSCLSAHFGNKYVVRNHFGAGDDTLTLPCRKDNLTGIRVGSRENMHDYECGTL